MLKPAHMSKHSVCSDKCKFTFRFVHLKKLNPVRIVLIALFNTVEAGGVSI